MVHRPDSVQTGDTIVPYSPEMYYRVALGYRETILRLGDTRAITYLLLLGQHVSREDRP
jgi:hypothetical protein